MRLFQIYLVIGLLICTWYGFAAAGGWQAVNFGILDGSSSSGRSYGGAWGGGK